MLPALAARLGADVPFFLDPRPALARGVGERLETLPLPPLPLVLVTSDAGLSTAAVYRAFDGRTAEETDASFAERAALAERSWRELSAAWSAGDLNEEAVVRQVAALLQNDLAAPSQRLAPPLVSTAQRLQEAGARAVQVSGSGPTLFGVFASDAAAGQAAAALRVQGLDALADGPAAAPLVSAP